MYTDEFAVLHAVGEHEFKRSAHIEKRRVVPAFRLARFLRFDAADDIVLARVLQSQTAAHQRRDDDFVVIVRGKSHARTGKRRRMNEQIVRASVPHADGERRLRQHHVHGRADAHKRQIVCDV